MAKTREKKIVHTGISGEQMEQAFADFAIADARIQAITSKMDVEITRIRERYQDDLTKYGTMKEQSFDILQAYATENRAEMFSKRKSLETVHGTMGFRIGTPKLKPLKGFTWGAITNLLKEFMPSYIRTTDEVAKDRLLADREDPDVAVQFAKVGVYVDQDESFFVEPKKEVA